MIKYQANIYYRWHGEYIRRMSAKASPFIFNSYQEAMDYATNQHWELALLNIGEEIETQNTLKDCVYYTLKDGTMFCVQIEEVVVHHTFWDLVKQIFH